MVRAVASWGVEIEYRVQREWRHDMTLLHNAALRKTLCAVKGSSGRKANGIAAVEDVETFARTTSERFLARTFVTPRGLVLAWWTRESLDGATYLLGGIAGAGVWMS